MASWINALREAVLATSFTIGNLTTSVRSRSRYFERLLSFGSSNGGDGAAPETELHRAAPMPAPGGDVEAGGLVSGVVPDRQPSVPAAAAGGGGGRTIGELAIPAVLSLGVYSSIPGDVQLHHRRGGGVRFLYHPLLTFIALAVGTSLCIIFYALTRFDGEGREGEEVESAKRRWMRVSIVFFLLAFMLRIFLLL